MISTLKKTSLKKLTIAAVFFVIIGTTALTNSQYRITFAGVSNKKTSQLQINYKINNVKYTYKSSKINYPQIVNLGNYSKQETINKIIKKDALNLLNINKSQGNDFTLILNYNVKLSKSKVLSIRYFGNGNVKGAVHPYNVLFTTNIDLNKDAKIKLSDMVKINTSLVKKFRLSKYIGPYKVNADLSNAVNMERGQLCNNDILNMFKTSDTAGYETCSYFTKNSLVIAIPATHVVGDYAEFEIKYKDLTNDMRTKNILWKNI